MKFVLWDQKFKGNKEISVCEGIILKSRLVQMSSGQSSFLNTLIAPSVTMPDTRRKLSRTAPSRRVNAFDIKVLRGPFSKFSAHRGDQRVKRRSFKVQQIFSRGTRQSWYLSISILSYFIYLFSILYLVLFSFKRRKTEINHYY